MKTKNIKIFALSILASIGFYGCADMDSLNQNPNASTNMDVDLIIPTVQYFTSSDWQRMHRLFIFPGGFMNQWTGEWATTEYGGHGQKQFAYFEYLWNTTYPEAIKNVVDMVERTKNDPEKRNAGAISRILKVQQFMRLTDYYGDIPYSEAGQGYHGGILKPKYDKQEDIYHDFLKELKEAAEQLDPSAIKPKNDLYYGGDIAKWKKFANSLRLRVAMRLVKVDPALAEAEAKDAIAAGVFSSNNDICYIKHEDLYNGAGGPGQGNGVSNLISSKRNSTGSLFYYTCEFIEAMEKRNDPRLLYIAGVYLNDKNKTEITSEVYDVRGSYAAMAVPAQMWAYETDPEGKYPTASIPIVKEIDGEETTIELAYTRLRPSNEVEAYDAPYIHMSYAEVAFLKAEVEARWGSMGKAETYYADGLRAAVEQWTLFDIDVKKDATKVDAFATNNKLTSGKEIEEINTQLWLLHFLDPLESWANWRRSGYPEIKFYNRVPNVNQTDGQTPRRIQYPLDEQKKNAANWNEAVTRMGGTDSWMNRVWWDAK